MIQKPYGVSATSRTRIYEWCNTYEKDAADYPWPGRPNTALVKALEISTLLRADRRLTVRTIALKFRLGTASVHDIITRQLCMR